MTYKNTKTILFAGLIAAMILPFSGMLMAEAAPNENANDMAKEKTKKYEVDILERTTTSIEYDEEGKKTERQIHKIKLIDKQTVKDLMDDNAEYLDYLRTLGSEGKKAAAQEIANYHEIVKNTPDVMEIEVLRIGENSIFFGPALFLSGSGGAPQDPVNVIFHEDGSAGNTRSIIDLYASHSWGTAFGSNLYAYIDETAHGGTAHFQINNYQLEEGDFFGYRQHIRIFQGGFDTHGQYDHWSIAGAHYEQFTGWPVHTVLSWQTGEDHIRSDLAGKTGVGTISNYNTYYSGSHLGVPFDSTAALVELT